MKEVAHAKGADSGHERWLLRVDTGGTFTDCLAVAPDGHRLEIKVLSSSALRAKIARQVESSHLELDADWDLPRDFFAGYQLRPLGQQVQIRIASSEDSGRVLRLNEGAAFELAPGMGIELLSPEEAPLLAARVATRKPLHEPLPPIDLRLGTTRGTNALLERKGARTALFVTAGFADLLRIGTQQRPNLFALNISRPAPLPTVVVEVDERLDAQGRVIREIDERALDRSIAMLEAEHIEAVAIALLHGYRNPAHEEIVERRLRDLGYGHISRSSAVAPFQQLLPRAQTTVVDAYLSPIIDTYVDSIRSSLGRTRQRIHVMTSAGGLASSKEYRPKDSLLSGPAGGVVGAAASGRSAGYQNILSLDMGGTSTDVARIDGDFEYQFEHKVGDAELFAPALAIETVAAGGGSICRVEHGRLIVGPESAGAFPGSACYGAGGPLTLTDVNLLLGRIRPERLPIPIDRVAAERRLQEQVDALRAQTGESADPASLLEGWLRIANERMAEAMRQVSLRRGYDPRDYALLAFGGAGGQHACAIAELLGIHTVLAPPSAGILSALGLHHARLERFVQRQVLMPFAEVGATLESILGDMAQEAIDAVAAEGVRRDEVAVERRLLEMRYEGQDSTLILECEPEDSPRALFERRYEELFAHRPLGKAVELVSLRVVARSTVAPVEFEQRASAPTAERSASHAEETLRRAAADLRRAGQMRAFSRDGWADIPCLERSALSVGACWEGPALLVEDHALLFVEAGWSAEVHPSGCVVVTRVGEDERRSQEATATLSSPAAVTLELFRHRFESIAREMGEHLRRTAISTNIKERLDFSCALLDAEGRLVVNAPHIPVHLGALGLCVRTLRQAVSMQAGDALVTNHPAFGGSHLPDLTVVAPVHDERGERLAYVAVRAHHAEIGGITPGSMPPDARSLAEEGVVLPPLHLLRRGSSDWAEVEARLREDRYPTRALSDNLADLRAMVACTRAGIERLTALAGSHGTEVVREQMDALRALALRHVQSALGGLGGDRFVAEDFMDDGSPLRVAVQLKEGRARIDFSGSADVHPGNMNATEAIVRSAVLYVLRLLVREPLPLNEGLMEAIDLVLPLGMLNPEFVADPLQCPAIVGGNVETSQRIVDVLLEAFELAGASQGTMNNVTFGNANFGYYETIGGGAGACESFDGASGVHTHMTNTRLTDAEVLEHRYPVRVRRLALRAGSGGAGRWGGGDGIVRELEFLEPVTLSVLTQRRLQRPYGMHGGAPGAPGRQHVLHADGTRIDLQPLDSIELVEGDRFVIETPGGGGFGELDAADHPRLKPA